jgi:hypothetical protein
MVDYIKIASKIIEICEAFDKPFDDSEIFDKEMI